MRTRELEEGQIDASHSISDMFLLSFYVLHSIAKRTPTKLKVNTVLLIYILWCLQSVWCLCSSSCDLWLLESTVTYLESSDVEYLSVKLLWSFGNS